MLTYETPHAVGLNTAKWNCLQEHLVRLVETDRISALSIQVTHQGKSTSPLVMGENIGNESLFLVASLTKPIFATALLLLMERGQISLNERVHHYLPQFRSHGKLKITIRNLLTHTSGLPDMPSDNLELRAAHAPLEQFWNRVCETELEFPPGTAARYQSMGFVVLGKIIEAVTGISAPEFLKRELFDPLGMNHTYLGIPNGTTETQSLVNRVVDVRLSGNLLANAGNWNSQYWRTFGAPWGGLISTVDDIAKFCSMVAQRGNWNGNRLIGSQTINASLSNQLRGFELMNSHDLLHRPWGFGWRLNWPAHRQTFADAADDSTVGHWGASGCLMWINPKTELAVIICTNEPSENSQVEIIKISNQILAAFEENEVGSIRL